MNNYAKIQIGSNTFLESFKASCFCDGTRVRAGRGGLLHFSSAIRKREYRSFRELRIKGGNSAFYFDKKLVLTFIGIILSQSVNLLIMT